MELALEQLRDEETYDAGLDLVCWAHARSGLRAAHEGGRLHFAFSILVQPEALGHGLVFIPVLFVGRT